MQKSLQRWKQDGAKILIKPAIDPKQNVNCALIQLEGNLLIELISPANDLPSPLASRLAKGGGLDHICTFVDDVEKSVAQYRKQGAIVLVHPTFGCVWNRTISFILLRDGMVLELMSRDICMADLPDPLTGTVLLESK